MRKSTAILCLTLTLFLRSVGMSASADFEKGVAAFMSDDYATALRGLKPLAEPGMPRAQLFLGVAYGEGWGFSEDDKIAVTCYRLATEKGDARSQSNLGVMYANGEGGIQDNVYAHMLYSIAASSGNNGRIFNRDSLVKEMTPAQLEKARDLARECVRKKYKVC